MCTFFHECQHPIHAVLYLAFFPSLSVSQIVYTSVHENFINLVYSSMDEQLGCFQVSVIVVKAAVPNIVSLFAYL